MPQSTIMMVLFYALIFGVMYFILIRPQKKQAKKTKDMLDQIKPGDKVVTIGGLHGVVDEVNLTNNTVILDCEGIFLTFEKRAISRIVDVSTIATNDGIVEQSDVEEPADTVVFDDTEDSDETNL
ncbi:preprotein translocase subunit YajC [Jeotgalibaca sp. MA1X17-3]|uniref:preprotein translocase subunit YajC n=1 Tax=Jeotgalibaca sp. MA1X17-3 TaxID=2908211 RepID=UPI001F42EA2E|nr:preprotein translocase subunit YajC [Jeotgalibaca sp. MA1X17-3]UJF14910.1 preprotein translocase subunit YajC [Jeotgalibaca sp. MA1X17-3]